MKTSPATTVLATLKDERNVWIFDLDNTLYPAHCDLFTQIEQKMGVYVQKALDLPPDEAKKIQKDYFHTYGTTLNGLMTVNGIDPHDYLAFVHDIDRTVVRPSPELDQALAGLPGRKLVYTNASRNHAEQTLDRLGLSRHFEDIFDITDSAFVPKPDMQSYERMMKKLSVDPKRSVFFEDTARNLAPAHDLGMVTVWIATDLSWATAGARQSSPSGLADHIHFSTDDLSTWLKELHLSK